MQHQAVTERIIGCAYQVFNSMGFGFLESVYEKCLAIELEEAGLETKFQNSIPVVYREKNVGEFVADILVEDIVIVELKSVKQLVTSHEIQLVNYLVATKIDVGLRINFGEQGVEIRRKLRILD